jgi:methylated-DNA-[protein]-cysteine S-methyltransferase
VEVKMQANPFFYSVVQTEFGETVVVRRQDRDRLPVCRIILPVSGRAASKWVKHEFPGAVFNPDACAGICRQILDFLEGKEVVFEAADIDFGIVDGFAKRVLTMAAGIPRGRVMTYGGLAASLGVPGGARAVGNALAANPFPLVIPCHRVIRSDRSLGGFGGGTKLKRALLELEQVSFDAKARVLPVHILS